VADEMLEFLAGAEVVIHNAAFDVGFLNAELRAWARASSPSTWPSVTDTWLMAREMFPGKANSLDALCRGWRWTTRTARCTAPCWTPGCWPRSTSA
jgi:DNA polymerase-3 subunit epsilon